MAHKPEQPAQRKHLPVACLLVAALLAWRPCPAAAQGEDQLLIDGIPLENVIVDRDFAVRLRAEVQFSEEDNDLIDEDPQFARFPAELYAGEAKVYLRNRATLSVTHDRWDNDLGLDGRRTGWTVRQPLSDRNTLVLRYLLNSQTGSADKHYAYAAVDQYFSKQLYSYSRLRFTTQQGADSTYQLYQYVSWRPRNRVRLGSLAAATYDEATSDINTWYAQLFSTVFLIEDFTSLRLEARHYDASSDLTFQDYKAHLYQRVGQQSFVRLTYRYYDDSADFSSHAYGIKIRHFFTPALSVHTGYRRYEHSESTDLDTLLAGMEILF